jgi:hypothetical protein
MKTSSNKGFVQEKWACLGNPSGKPVDQRIQEAEKLGFSTICIKISLKNTGIKINSLQK